MLASEKKELTATGAWLLFFLAILAIRMQGTVETVSHWTVLQNFMMVWAWMWIDSSIPRRTLSTRLHHVSATTPFLQLLEWIRPERLPWFGIPCRSSSQP